jgi:hypothetical protein
MIRVSNLLCSAVVSAGLLLLMWGCASSISTPAPPQLASDGQPTKVTPPGLPPGTRMPQEAERIKEQGFENSHLTRDPVTGRLPSEDSEEAFGKASSK